MSDRPIHIAIIPDGNRRWAKKAGMKPWEGHRAGADRIEEISREALKKEIKHLTFWGSSKDNLQKRPLEEKRELLRIYEKYFQKLITDPDVYENKTGINIVGDWEKQFPRKLKNILMDGIEKTKNHTHNFLNFMLAYNGDDDVLHAVKKIKESILKEKKNLKITADLFKENLLSSKLPPVDLIIRTGTEGDPHNSAGFLMWQTQNSQYHFSEKLFPDFGPKDFRKIVEEFKKRKRRLGK
jgi:undecaprenyl diphosphate synthase